VRLGTVPALVGGAAGLLGAAAVAGIAQQRRIAIRDRAGIDPETAAALSRAAGERSAAVQTDDGLSLYAELVGPDDAELTVLFVHGLNLLSFQFQRRAITAAFGDRVRQVYYDQRSHGRSADSPTDGCTIEQLGRDLYGVLDQLVPSGPVVLVGHSMGGMTVMALADQHPELFGRDGRVPAVALINTSPGDLRTISLGLPSALARLHAPLLPFVLRRAARNAALVERGRALGRDLAWVVTKRLSFADRNVDPAVVEFAARMIEATPVNVVASFYPTLVAHDGRQGVQNLAGCSVLVIGADSDALTPVSHSERIARTLPDAQLIIAPNSGHLLMLEHPEQVNRPLLALLESSVRDTGRVPIR
jgi:pimeloyl-ACP methyl ester carboxylesterase